MMRDRFDLPVSTTSQVARDAYVAGVDLILAARVGAADAFADALRHDEGFALAHAGLARLAQGDARMDEAKAHAARATQFAAGASARERGLVAIMAHVVNGRAAAAMTAIEAHAVDFPRDAVAVVPALGVYGLFGFSGRADHPRAQRALLEKWAPSWGTHWWFDTYYGWSHVETGEPAKGAAILDRALAGNPNNAHARHARAHAYFELGESRDGAAMIENWLPGYDPRSQLHCHLSWHRALFEVDQGRDEVALGLFASAIRPGVTHCAPMPALVDPAAFAWRMAAYGGDAGLLWPAVKRHVEGKFPRGGFAFADAHAAMVEAATGDFAALDARIGDLEALDRGGKLPQGPVVARVCRALGAFARGESAKSADLLEASLAELPRLGGSRAQREVFEDTLIAACLRSGRRARARDLLNERLSRRPRAQDQRWLAAAQG